MRRTKSCVQLMSTPSSIASSTIWLPGIAELNAQHQAEAANLFDECVFLGELVETHAEIPAHMDDVGQEFVEKRRRIRGRRGRRAVPRRMWIRACRGPMEAAARSIGDDDAQRNAAHAMGLAAIITSGHDHGFPASGRRNRFPER